MQAVPAHAARGDERADHAVADLHPADVGADLLDHAGALVAEDDLPGMGNVPLITERSEWHTPLAVIRTITSVGPGSSGVTSSTDSGWSCSRQMAAFM